jgi:hypothetical protein
MEEQRAIDKVAIPGYPEIETDLSEIWMMPEAVGFGYGSEEEEKQALVEEYGQEWVDENFVSWAEQQRQQDEEEGKW